MKLLILFFSLFFSFNQKLNINSEYEEQGFIEYVYGDYILHEKQEELELYYNGEKIESIRIPLYYKIIFEDKILTIFYKTHINDYINVKEYSKGKISNSTKINNKLCNSFDIIKYNDEYFLVSTIFEYENEIVKESLNEKEYLSQKNGIILILDNEYKIKSSKIYGGKLDDQFNNLYLNERTETLYITGIKEQNSGFDFGYGGNGVKGYLLIKCDINLNIIEYVIFDDVIENIEINQEIIIYTKTNMFLLDYDLNVISSLKFSLGCIFGSKLNNECFVIFYQNNLKIYDFNKNILLSTYNYPFSDSINQIDIINNYVYLRDDLKIYKSVFYDNKFNNYKFIYDTLELDNTNLEILGIPINFRIKEIKYESGYDRSKFGVYDLFLDYDFFTINSKIEVLPRSTVSNNNIYPKGYKILFSGVGYLNGIEIANNYSLDVDGDYELKLIGKDSERIINFSVYDMDINYFEDDLKYWDYEIYPNQELQIDISYLGDLNIKQLIINNNEHSFINDIDNKIISIKISSNESGVFIYNIEKIIYVVDEKEYSEILDYKVIVNVLKEKISINNDLFNNEESFIFKTEILNNDNQIRFIKMLIDDTGEYYYIPIKEGLIKLNDLIKSTKTISFYIVYDVGSKMYEEKYLYSLKYDFSNINELGVMKIKKDGQNINEISIFVENNNKLKSVIIDDKVVFENKNNRDYTLICISIVSIIFLFGGYKTYKVIKKRQ